MKVGTFGISGMRCGGDGRDRAHLAGLGHLLRQIDRRKIHLRIAAHHRRHRIGRALERHVHDVDPGRLAEQRAGDEVVLASPGEEKLSVPGFALARSISSLRFLRRNLGIDDQIERRRAHAGDAGKILDRIERQILVHQPGDGVAVRGQHQRVAVGRRLRHAERCRRGLAGSRR